MTERELSSTWNKLLSEMTETKDRSWIEQRLMVDQGDAFRAIVWKILELEEKTKNNNP